MRILHVAHCYPPAIGGSEILIEQLSRRLVADYGHQVTVVTTTGYTTASFRSPEADTMPPGTTVRDGVEVRRHDADPRIARALRRIHRPVWRLHLPGNSVLRTLYDGPHSTGMLRDVLSVEADIVGATAFPLMHMHYAWLAARRRAAPFVIYGALHPEDPWGYDRATIRQLARSAAAYVAYTPYEAEHAERLGVRREAIRVIPPGIEPSELVGTGWDLRADQGIPDDATLFGFVGQISRGKGVFDLLEAFAMVALDLPDAWLLMAGGTTADIPVLRKALSRLPEDVTARVRILENFDGALKGDIYRALDVFVTPSMNESYGITTVEAWHCGVPVIATRLAAVESFVRHGEDALLVERAHWAGLAGAMVEIAADDEFRERLVAAGRQRAASLTWADTAAAVNRLYEELAR